LQNPDKLTTSRRSKLRTHLKTYPIKSGQS
jgi:hypothetical protein